ncbi:MAG: hypothetical protein RML99_13290, partial [Anaerolineae bacterium]|nr:hypothetical protein [Anaerolineae bacterium]
MTISPADERDLLSGALPEALAREDLANLAVLLRYASDGCFAVAVYNDALAREQVVDALRRLVAPLPVFEWTYSKLDPYPSGYLDRLTDAQRRGRAVVFFFGLDQAGPDVIKSLDYHRERLSGHPHGLVFWVTPGFASRMACTAPHFWSQRSGVFDFTVACAAPASPADDVLQRMITDSTAWDDREERERALRLYQALLKEYEANPATPARALFDLHLRLARLLYYDDRPDEAKAHALAALELAKRLDRPRDRADALQTLG